jgi:hypothetical protein
MNFQSSVFLTIWRVNTKICVKKYNRNVLWCMFIYKEMIKMKGRMSSLFTYIYTFFYLYKYFIHNIDLGEIHKEFCTANAQSSFVFFTWIKFANELLTPSSDSTSDMDLFKSSETLELSYYFSLNWKYLSYLFAAIWIYVSTNRQQTNIIYLLGKKFHGEHTRVWIWDIPN